MLGRRLDPKSSLVLLVLASCSSGRATSPAPVPTPPACPALPAAQGRATFVRSDLAVANLAGSCRDRGGNAVTVRASGILEARVEWSDPRAVLQLEVWRGLFVDRIAQSVREGTSLCATASVAVEAGDHVVAVCHASDSQLPLGVGPPTPFIVYAIYP